MRKLCLFFLVLSFMTTQVFAAVNFGNRSSAIKVADGATLNIQDGFNGERRFYYKKGSRS